MKNRKGFTLIELLAVIAILAILVIIALPNVINLYNKAQKETFLTETKKIHSEAEKKFISDSISNKTTKVINSEDNTKLDMTGEKLQYCVILDNNGKITSMKVSNGKWIASLENGKTIDSLTIDDLEDGNLDNYKCNSNTSSDSNIVYCTFDGDLVQGAEYVNGQYTYKYMYSGAIPMSSNYDDKIKATFMSNNYYVMPVESDLYWSISNQEGWGMQLTDNSLTEPVTSKMCTYINNKPVIYMSGMFYRSKASYIDMSGFNTSNVVSMAYMFFQSDATSIKGLEDFDTRNVTNMSRMFDGNQATVLDLSSFDTSNVTDMDDLFSKASNLKTIYASDKFVTTNAGDVDYMFNNCSNLVGGAGTLFDSTKIDKTYARIDGGTSNPGYFTKK